MAWIPITLPALDARKIAAIVDACSEAARRTASRRAPEIIASVVRRVRRKIASCRQNVLDADETTIPESLLDDVVKLILADLKNVLEEALTPAEENELRRIDTDLNRIASCQDIVEKPDTAEATPSAQSTTGTPRITPRPRTFDRTSQDGL